MYRHLAVACMDNKLKLANDQELLTAWSTSALSWLDSLPAGLCSSCNPPGWL